MMAQLDDLEAVRNVVKALEGFTPEDQERILRWTREKVGLPLVGPSLSSKNESTPQPTKVETQQPSAQARAVIDIKSFFTTKNPQRDTHIAATVAYYYRFEAPEGQRSETINAEVLQDAMRLAGRPRLKNPATTLNNAVTTGLLDRADRGAYTISTVGENLVAMSLPGAAKAPNGAKRAKKQKQEVSTKASTTRRK